MIEIFIFDNSTNTLRINEYSILLIKEFADLWDIKRNKCKEDKTGKERLLAFKEFTYIYLSLDYKSPYFSYLEQDKHYAALVDSGLESEHIKNPEFIAAYNKYKEIQESDPILSLIKIAHRTLYKTQVFLDSIDYTELDEMQRPLYKPKSVIEDIGSIAKMRNSLIELEEQHKKRLVAQSKLRGDAEPGFDEI